MTNKPTDSSLLELLGALSDLAVQASADIALIGARARMVWGSDELADSIDIVASGNPAGDSASGLPVEGVSYVHLLPQVRWTVRRDEYRGLYTAAEETAVIVPGLPLRVVTPDLLGAMLLADKSIDSRSILLANIVAGTIEPEALLEACGRHLGPYAISDARSVIADAEWHAMTMKFGKKENVH